MRLGCGVKNKDQRQTRERQSQPNQHRIYFPIAIHRCAIECAGASARWLSIPCPTRRISCLEGAQGNILPEGHSQTKVHAALVQKLQPARDDTFLQPKSKNAIHEGARHRSGK